MKILDKRYFLSCKKQTGGDLHGISPRFMPIFLPRIIHLVNFAYNTVYKGGESNFEWSLE